MLTILGALVLAALCYLFEVKYWEPRKRRVAAEQAERAAEIQRMHDAANREESANRPKRQAPTPGKSFSETLLVSEPGQPKRVPKFEPVWTPETPVETSESETGWVKNPTWYDHDAPRTVEFEEADALEHIENERREIAEIQARKAIESAEAQAKDALVNLGYKATDAKRAIAEAQAEVAEAGADELSTVSEILKAALQHLGPKAQRL